MKIQHIIVFAGLGLVTALGGCGGSDGDDGSDGADSLVRTSGISADTTCPSGGTRIDSGLDANGNGTLDSNEITATEVICNGAGAIGWSSPEEIESMDRSANNPVLDVNASGEALALWSQDDDDSDDQPDLRVARYGPATGWSSPRTLDNEEPRIEQWNISLNDQCQALAVWSQDGSDSDTVIDLRARYYDPADGWQPERVIEQGNGYVQSPDPAMAENSQAIVIWSQSGSIRSNRFTRAGGWNAKSLDIDGMATPASRPEVAMDDTGNALATWRQSDATESDTIRDVRANRYDVATAAWKTGAWTLESANNGGIGNISIAMNGDGSAVAIWQQMDGSYRNIRSDWYKSGNGWQGNPVTIEFTDRDAFYPDVAIDPDGNAVAVWVQNFGQDNLDDVRSNYFAADQGWRPYPQSVEKTRTSVNGFPRVAMDGQGNAMAAWNSQNRHADVWSNRARGGQAWGIAQLRETSSEGSALVPDVGMARDGNAVMIWKQYDGSRNNIRAALYKHD